MKEKIWGILDSDEKYSIKLTDYINEQKLSSCKAMAFTSADALKNSLNKYELAVFICSKEFEEQATEVHTDNLIWLQDDEDEEVDNGVYRYQPAPLLVKDVVAHVEGFSRKKGRDETTRIISVYAPYGKCFKTSLSIAMAARAAKKGRTLLISLEQFSGLKGILPINRGGISEAMYYYLTDSTGNSYGKIEACMDSIFGFDFFAPAICADDITFFENRQFLDFVDVLIQKGCYKYVIIDLDGIINRPWEIIEASNKVVMPKANDYMSVKKCEEFEKYLLLSGREGLLDKIFKIKLPYDESVAGYEIQPEFLLGSVMDEVVWRCLDD